VNTARARRFAPLHLNQPSHQQIDYHKPDDEQHRYQCREFEVVQFAQVLDVVEYHFTRQLAFAGNAHAKVDADLCAISQYRYALLHARTSTQRVQRLFTYNSSAILKPTGLTNDAHCLYTYAHHSPSEHKHNPTHLYSGACIPKKPDIGSLNGVNGRANARAPALITRRYTGQLASTDVPGAYRVPSTNGAPSINACKSSGTFSGGCCRSASMQMRYFDVDAASLKPRNTADDNPRSVVRTMILQLYAFFRHALTTSSLTSERARQHSAVRS
jgi:hypothetical protein